MRITNNMMISNTLRSLQRNMNAISKSQEMMATGKKFILPSDDPIAMAKSLRLNSDISDSEQYKKNCDAAISWMEMTEDSVDKIQKVLTRANALAVQAANEVNTEDETEKIGEELKQLRQELISQGNATYAGRYLYSGFKTDAKLIDDNGKYNVTVGKTTSKEFAAGSTPPVGGGLDIEIFNDGITKKVVNVPYGVSPATINITTTDLKAGTQSTAVSPMSPAADTSTWSGLADAITKNADLKAAGITASVVSTTTNTINFVINANNADIVNTVTGEVAATSTPPAAPSTYNLEIFNDGNTKKVVNIPYGNVPPASAAINITTTITTPPSTSTAPIPMVADTSTWAGLAATINSIPAVSAAGITANIVSVSANTIRLDIDHLGLKTQPENIEYLVGVSDTLKVNVLGTDLFGVGVKGEVPNLVKTFDDFISALTVKSSQFDLDVDKCAVGSDLSAVFTKVKNSNLLDADSLKMLQDKINAIPGPTVLDKTDKDIQAQLTNIKSVIKDGITKYRQSGFQSAIANTSSSSDNTAKIRAQIGAIANRADLTSNRLDEETTNFTKLLSQNEDVDLEEIITKLTSQQAVYQASLSVGAKVIQPSLVDFIK